jgi:hypothetical protein
VTVGAASRIVMCIEAKRHRVRDAPDACLRATQTLPMMIRMLTDAGMSRDETRLIPFPR